VVQSWFKAFPLILLQALPYGAIGFVSHILTYYTIAILSIGRSPIRPWRSLSSPNLDLALAVAGLVLGNTVTIYTMVKCRRRWQFVLIAFWKAMLSISLGMLSAHAATIVRRSAPRRMQAREEYQLELEKYNAWLESCRERYEMEHEGVYRVGYGEDNMFYRAILAPTRFMYYCPMCSYVQLR
jgi:hypothetical protein